MFVIVCNSLTGDVNCTSTTWKSTKLGACPNARKLTRVRIAAERETFELIFQDYPCPFPGCLQQYGNILDSMDGANGMKEAKSEIRVRRPCQENTAS